MNPVFFAGSCHNYTDIQTYNQTYRQTDSSILSYNIERHVTPRQTIHYNAEDMCGDLRTLRTKAHFTQSLI